MESIKLRLRLISTIIILALLCGACGVLFERTSSGDILSAAIRRQHILRQITSITNAVLLEERVSELYLWDNDPYYNCVRGGGNQIYGSVQPYAEIVAEYEEAFAAMGWVSREPSELAYEGIVPYRNAENTLHLVIGPSIEHIGYSEYPAEWMQFQTVYYVDFLYAEPSVTACYG